MKIGIIAEDDSDVAVVASFTRRLLRPHPIGFKSFVGNGCGKLRRKCTAWSLNLVQQGCPGIVVVHDLDANDEVRLRDQLTESVLPARPALFVVLIPRREIEAWLLYDSAAIARAFREHVHLPLPGNPEALADPKRHLRDLIRVRYRKTYLHTIHNPAIANHVNIALLRRARSFLPHFRFIADFRTRLP